MQTPDGFYIDGAWRPASGHDRIDVINPATEQRIARVAAAGPADVDAAVMAARAAFPAWSDTSPAERIAVLQRIAAGLDARREEIAQTIRAEMGMPIRMARRIQAALPEAVFDTTAQALAGFEASERAGNAHVERVPVGVVAAITPWNYPLHQIAAKVAPALAAGCTVVLKPSEVAPLDALIFAEVVHAAGLPPGVFNLVTGHGRSAGAALAAHPEVDAISFTGSTSAGQLVATSAARGIKRVALELGGKSASIVLDDADLATAVRATVSNCLLNSGQTCNALTRLVVPASLHDEAARIAVETATAMTLGDPAQESTKLGPLASAAQRARVRHFIGHAVSDGAELLCGGAEPPAGLEVGYFVAPTVFGRVHPDSALAQEEVFGPVLAIIEYPDGAEDAAVRIANGTPYGLSGAVWSASDERAVGVARRLRSGQVHINGGAFDLLAPMGGMKHSGLGRELGRYGIEEFLEYRALLMPAATPAKSAERRPAHA